jgi:hypothetical protein
MDFFFGVQLSGTLPPCRAFNKNGIGDCLLYIFPEGSGFVQNLNECHFSTGARGISNKPVSGDRRGK